MLVSFGGYWCYWLWNLVLVVVFFYWFVVWLREFFGVEDLIRLLFWVFLWEWVLGKLFMDLSLGFLVEVFVSFV